MDSHGCWKKMAVAKIGKSRRNAIRIPVIPTLILQHSVSSYEICQPGGVSHGPDVPPDGEPPIERRYPIRVYPNTTFPI